MEFPVFICPTNNCFVNYHGDQAALSGRVTLSCASYTAERHTRFSLTIKESPMRKNIRLIGFAIVVFIAGFAVGQLVDATSTVSAAANPVFELRTYTTLEGKLPNLLARFRDHTMGIFEKHGMTNVGYWVPQDSPGSDDTLIYILSHDSREAAQKSWSDFGDDPEWDRVAEESQVNGRIVSGVERVFMDSTDFSPMK